MSLISSIKNSDYIAPFIDIEAQTYGGKDFVDGLVVTPLDSNFAAIPSQIVKLTGTRTPHMPFTFGREQRINKTYYTGSDEPVIQVLGEKQDDLVINGEFVDRRYYPDSNLIGTAANENISMGFVNYFEALCNSRQSVLLSMQDRYTASQNRFDYTRYGILIKTQFQLKRVSEITYSLTFSLFTQNKPFYNFFANIPSSQNVLNGAFNLSNVAANLEALPSLYPDADSSLLGKVSSAISTAKKAIATATKAIESFNKLTQDITKSVDRFLGILDGCLASVSSLKYNLTALYNDTKSIPDKTKRIASNACILATTSLINFPDKSSSNPNANFSSYFTDPNNQNTAKNQTLPSQSIDAIIRQMRQQFIDSIKKLQVRTYLVADGDTLQRISYKMYGDSNYWTKILLYNHLNSTRLVVGTTLSIPDL